MRQARCKEKEITQGRHNLQRVAGKQHKEKLKGEQQYRGREEKKATFKGCAQGLVLHYRFV